MPKLGGVVDTLEGVPEAYHSNYEQKDGKFILKEIEFEDPAQWREKLTKKEKLLTDANSQLGRYSNFKELADEELSELLELREMKKQGKALTVDEKADLERLHNKALGKVTSELTAEREARKAEQALLRRYELTDPIRAIATSEAVGMFPEDFDLAWSEIGSRFLLKKEDGKKSKIVVLDEDGDETDIKLEDFFNKLYKQRRPKFFKASGSGGGGTPPNNGAPGGGKTISREAFDKMSQAERMKALKDGTKVVD